MKADDCREMEMRWLLGLDVGTNSIGWWAYEITKNNKVTRSIDGGVRLFPDGREPSSRGRVGDSLAVSRRMARGMRRNREHRQLRMSKLTEALIGAGLLPENDNERKALFQTPSKTNGDPLAWDPYRLRAKAAKETVTPMNWVAHCSTWGFGGDINPTVKKQVMTKAAS